MVVGLVRNGFLMVIIFFVVRAESTHAQLADSHWPAITHETRPWTRWWWHGSAVTKEGVTAELESFKEAGFGGVEITPIYGAFGYEDKFIDYLSAEWVDILMHTLREAGRLGLGVDMATGTGWPFGGPWVTEEHACKNFRIRTFHLRAGETLQEKIQYTQQPLLRLVGPGTFFPFKIAGANGQTSETEALLRHIQQPVSANKNLQALGIDQVQFEKPLRLITLMAYGDRHQTVDLTALVDSTGRLNWTAPDGSWTLHALFQGWHGKLVERAGPGGEGNVIDHFSAPALMNYLLQFDRALAGKDIGSLRAFFNDSYEVDDAAGAADWTPDLLREFKNRRGYELRNFLHALIAEEENEISERVLTDYRQTISELLLENFTLPWRAWAHDHHASVRNQAHGSPANILDLYSVVDIPEIEGTEPLRIRMASSAANVSGKRLVAAEAATWLNEHFQSTLSDVKEALDRFMLNGVNHLVYHGTAYSPADAPWPGWLFYAAVHFNKRNPIWNDLDALNMYVTRCQSFLQSSKPDNDILIYYPVFDTFAKRGSKMLQHIDGTGKDFEAGAFARCAKVLLENGYSFDFISDKQISGLHVMNHSLTTPGGGSYKAIVVPKCKYIPMQTLQRLDSIARSGVHVIFFEGMPESIPGLSGLDVSRTQFQKYIEGLRLMSTRQPNVKISNDIQTAVLQARMRSETLGAGAIGFIRKRDDRGNTLYFIVNSSSSKFTGTLSLSTPSRSWEIFEPMTGETGALSAKTTGGESRLTISLRPGQSLILRSCSECLIKEPFSFYGEGPRTEVTGTWAVAFSGSPELSPVTTDSLTSWTKFGGATFSGTGTYEIDFDKPLLKSRRWGLDLGQVSQSAEVYLNGQLLGTAIGPSYWVEFPDSLLEKTNRLRIVVSNLMANRIADMDRKKILWKTFYNINFAARLPENRKDGIFDASAWPPMDSGLIGPVALVALKPLR